VIEVEVENRSGAEVDEARVAALARRVLEAEGVEAGELGIDEATDVLSFPLDGRQDVPEGLPRQLGDLVLCPQVVGDAWQAPLVHGVLHLLGYDHGPEMEAREAALA
jgi:probable rRNA maturation factor